MSMLVIGLTDNQEIVVAEFGNNNVEPLYDGSMVIVPVEIETARQRAREIATQYVADPVAFERLKDEFDNIETQEDAVKAVLAGNEFGGIPRFTSETFLVNGKEYILELKSVGRCVKYYYSLELLYVEPGFLLELLNAIDMKCIGGDFKFKSATIPNQDFEETLLRAIKTSVNLKEKEC